MNHPSFSIPQADDFRIEHLADTEEHKALLQSFRAGNDAAGLEAYLKNWALPDELSKESRTYLVRDAVSGELACYFSIRTALIPYENPDGSLGTVSALELANFAVNSAYVEIKKPMLRIGAYVFSTFILPMAQAVSAVVGAKCLCIYALPESKLVAYYEKLGFSRLPFAQEVFVHDRIKPYYDKDCIFMYQLL